MGAVEVLAYYHYRFGFLSFSRCYCSHNFRSWIFTKCYLPKSVFDGIREVGNVVLCVLRWPTTLWFQRNCSSVFDCCRVECQTKKRAEEVEVFTPQSRRWFLGGVILSFLFSSTQSRNRLMESWNWTIFSIDASDVSSWGLRRVELDKRTLGSFR